MKVERKFKDESNQEIRVSFEINDDELISIISQKSIDERIVFFRKLFQTDIMKTLKIQNFLKLL